MRYRDLTLVLGAVVCVIVAGCGEPVPTAIDDVLQASTEGSGKPTDPPVELPADPPGQTVGDVTAESPTPAPGSSPMALGDGVVRARVRNESDVSADVTVRFIQGETIVHLAFVRVLPVTVTTVISPDAADRVELSGIDTLGRALRPETLIFGLDFDESMPAEYVIALQNLHLVLRSRSQNLFPTLYLVQTRYNLSKRPSSPCGGCHVCLAGSFLVSVDGH